MTGSVEPLVSVIVPTRDRPESLARCLESILLGQPHRYEIIVVDQSEAPGGAGALVEFGPVAKLVRWERPALSGRSAAINYAVAIARAPLIATVDDDTTVGGGWLERGVAAFGARPEAAAVLGPLLAGRRPEGDELLTTFRRTRPATWRGRLARGRLLGVGANAWFRRETFERVGPFDPFLGPGGRFAAAEDVDYVIRILRAGLTVAYDPELVVRHWGFRSYGDPSGQRMLQAYSRGLGAMLAKHLRQGDPWSLGLLARDIAWEGRAVVRALDPRYRVPFVPRLPSLAAGFARGLVQPLDRTSGVFVEGRD